MKRTLLILTQNSVAKIGIASYLSAIFSPYLAIDSMQAADLTPEVLKKVDCILFSKAEIAGELSFPIPQEVGQIVCMRTFNHTYLHKILQIPPGSTVYLVNDNKKTATEVIRQLQEFGFSQYQFLPYYPGCPEPSKDILYAVTPGEVHLVPGSVRTIVDIHNRVVDISTINEIIAFFELPTSLADEVTRNYMSHIVQVLKLSNQQLSRTLDLKELNRILIDSSPEGLCLLDASGRIALMNAAFRKLIGFKEHGQLIGSLTQLFSDYEIPYDFPAENDVVIKKEGIPPFRLWFQKFNLNQDTEYYLLHGVFWEEPSDEETFPSQTLQFCNFNYFVTNNATQRHLLDTARRMSLNDYHIVIQGESGTEKEMLAQAIHHNSNRHGKPFISLNFSSLRSSDLEAELLGARENSVRGLHHRTGAFEAAAGGTLLINGIQHMSPEAQQLLLNVLQNGYFLPLGSNTPQTLDVRVIATTNTDLYSLVLDGRFLDDLFFLLNMVSLDTVPLRKRRDDIPLLLENALKFAFKDPSITTERLLSDNLTAFLTQYDWPGNNKELNNLCTYFSCLYKRETLHLEDLPGYILNQVRNHETPPDLTEKKILSIIADNPRLGRSSIQSKLTEEGISLSEGKIRTVLQHLAEEGYITIRRTRGGCEATELGRLMIHV